MFTRILTLISRKSLWANASCLAIFDNAGCSIIAIMNRTWIYREISLTIIAIYHLISFFCSTYHNDRITQYFNYLVDTLDPCNYLSMYCKRNLHHLMKKNQYLMNYMSLYAKCSFKKCFDDYFSITHHGYRNIFHHFHLDN